MPPKQTVQTLRNPFEPLEVDDEPPAPAREAASSTTELSGPSQSTDQQRKRKGQSTSTAVNSNGGPARSKPSASGPKPAASSPRLASDAPHQAAPDRPRPAVQPVPPTAASSKSVGAKQQLRQQQQPQHNVQANGRASDSAAPTKPKQPQQHSEQVAAPDKRRLKKRHWVLPALWWWGLLAGVAWMVQQENVKLGVHHTDVSVAGINMTLPLPTVEVPALPTLTNMTTELTDLQAQIAAKMATLYAAVSAGNLSLPDPTSLLPESSWDVLDKLRQVPGMAGVFSSSAGSEGPGAGAATAPTQAKLRPGQVLAGRGLQAKHPVVIVPGFITSQLELWQGHPCATRYFRQRMWGTLTMMQVFLRNSSCWFQHICLDLATGLDPAGVKLRAAQGLEAVDFFVQGYWVWGKLVEALADVGYDTNNLVTMSYDWRLAIPLMEARDAWFTRTQHTIEALLAATNEKAVVVSHSYGENVARSFLHWIEGRSPGWVDKHLHAHVAIAGPTLGVPKALTSLLSGETYDTAQLGGLSAFLTDRMLPRATRARLFRSWGSVLAMLPVGGPKVWGNATWAPDDTDMMRAANRSYGALITSAPLKDPKTMPNSSSGNATPATTELPDLSDKELQEAVEELPLAEAMCEGVAAADVQVTSDEKTGTVSANANITASATCTMPAAAQEAAAAAAVAAAADGAAADKDADTSDGSTSSIVDTVKNWFTVSDERAAGELLDTSQLRQMHVGTALKLGMRVSGPLMTHHYQEWAAVHGERANKPPQDEAQDVQDVEDIVSDLTKAETGNSETDDSDCQRVPKASTAGRSEQQHKRALPLFPNALTVPLPDAPSFKTFCFYGVGLPTERAYHYVQPDGWHPSQLDQPQQQDIEQLLESLRNSSSNSNSGSGNSTSRAMGNGSSSANGTAGASAAQFDNTSSQMCKADGSSAQTCKAMSGESKPAVAKPAEAKTGDEKSGKGSGECEPGWDHGGGMNDDGQGGCSDSSDGQQQQQQALQDMLEGTYEWRINTALHDPATNLDSGIQQDTGDVTVPLLSLGAMCRGGWKSKRLNPAGSPVITREYQHVPAQGGLLSNQPRGGSTSGQHIDILGNEELLVDVLLVATGQEVEDRVVTRIDEIVARIPWEEPDGWDWQAQPQHWP